ncbi:unnamed protein product [Cylicocyclus nassatus]|uniref:SCP domain-containing protein n=1 Tax=Cylicocyclus nassatus TaxID=53992 RepID=A0AA36DQ78_CYLNA|nr:unnamed protein product [Cylicocyclus nassatus]
MTSSQLIALVFFIALAAVNAYKKPHCSNGKMTDKIRDLFLSFHNNARRRVAQGKEPNKVGKLHPAKNMYELEWDCKMEQQAQKAISSCSDEIKNWANMAQNVMTWTSTGGFDDPIKEIKSTLDIWWSKAKRHGVNDAGNRYTSTSLYSFANMVHSETTKIGCTYNICKNKMVITCLYNEIGYSTNEIMWETGRACKTGADCTTYPNSGCSAGLCTKGANVKETNHMCPKNKGMTDRARQKFLSLHNQFRSRAARGLEPDPLGGKTPKASKMLKMVYDCAVEASAMRHANKCVYQHSQPSQRKGLGENLFKTTVLDLNKVKAATQSSEGWWNELKDYGIGRSNKLTQALWNRPNKPIGHYTQMAWGTSHKLGCAVVACPKFTYAVCQYGPAGNYLGRVIYSIGEPCSGCPGKCSKSEGLYFGKVKLRRKSRERDYIPFGFDSILHFLMHIQYSLVLEYLRYRTLRNKKKLLILKKLDSDAKTGILIRIEIVLGVACFGKATYP